MSARRLFSLLSLAAALGAAGCYQSHQVDPAGSGPVDPVTWDSGPRRDAGVRPADRCGCPCLDEAYRCSADTSQTVLPGVPFGASVHWGHGGCIRPTYHPALAALAPRFEAALRAWIDLPCSSLCAEPLQIATEFPELCEFRMHLAPFGPGDHIWGECDSAGYEFATPTGRIASACITADESVSDGELLRRVGIALGFSSLPPGDPPSVMRRPVTIDALSEADIAGYCAMYGTPALCGEGAR